MDIEPDDPYESLPESSGAVTHMMAGAAAGIMEHCVMYPVDCVKTRMQCLVPDPRADYRSVPDAFYKIVRFEGMKNTVRGISVVVGGAGPAHALYFACYEKLKKVISGGKQGNHFAHGVAGCVATLIHDAVMNPVDVIKQRMQMYNSPYQTCKLCTKQVLQEEGWLAFYRSYTTQLTMNIPFQCVHFMTYEIMQDLLNKDRKYDPPSHVISGATAGASAAIVTMPLDVCKTLLNTQEHCARTRLSYVNGMVSAFRTVYEFQGLPGFFRGLTARVLFQMPATAISWSVYEFFKYFLTKKPEDLDDNKYMKVIKQRMQMYNSPYQTCKLCTKQVLQEEGWLAFYRSYTTQLTMNIPFQCVHFMTYEIMQDLLNKDRKYDPPSHVISGATAGASAAIVTMPLDVCKTLLNTQEHCARTRLSYVNGMVSAFRTVYEFQGLPGFFRGLTARVLFQMPATAISWSVYEFFKYFLTKKPEDLDDNKYMKGIAVQASSSPPSAST